MSEPAHAAAPTPVATAPAPLVVPAPGFAARLGLAVVAPRWAFALAGDRRRAGASGSDMLALIALVLLATQLRWLVSAGWLGVSVGAGLGLRAFAAIATRSLTMDLAVLMLCVLVLYAAAGARRDRGRAFDLACVAALPLLLVDLIANVAMSAAQVEPEPILGWALVGAAFGWTGVLLVLAVGPARVATARPIAVAAPVAARGAWAGRALIAVVLIGVATQARWIGGHADDIRPIDETGGPAPAFALPEIDAAGRPGAPLALISLRGKPVVLDFWATWCGPCLASLPILDEFTRAHPEVAVVAIDIDDPAAARALFRDKHYAMTLVAGDDDVQRRYGVMTIPHTVVIDAAGDVRKVGHVGDMDLDATIAALGR